MEGQLNLPPPRGPPDANGYRASPPYKFPKALLSVSAEIERKSGVCMCVFVVNCVVIIVLIFSSVSSASSSRIADSPV